MNQTIQHRVMRLLWPTIGHKFEHGSHVDHCDDNVNSSAEIATFLFFYL